MLLRSYTIHIQISFAECTFISITSPPINSQFSHLNWMSMNVFSYVCSFPFYFWRPGHTNCLRRWMVLLTLSLHQLKLRLCASKRFSSSLIRVTLRKSFKFIPMKFCWMYFHINFFPSNKFAMFTFKLNEYECVLVCLFISLLLLKTSPHKLQSFVRFLFIMPFCDMCLNPVFGVC